MRRPRTSATKSERINLCITTAHRQALEHIADREDRDLGYVASWFVQWGIRHYLASGASLVAMKGFKVARQKQIHKLATERLVLREEAQREHEQFSDRAGEKKRA